MQSGIYKLLGIFLFVMSLSPIAIASGTRFYASAAINADLSGFRLDIVSRQLLKNKFCELNVDRWLISRRIDNGEKSLNLTVSASDDRCISGTGHHYGWQWFNFDNIPYGKYGLMINGENVGLLDVDQEVVRVIR